MKEAKFFPFINFFFLLLLFLFIFISVTPLFSQTNTAPKTRYKKYPFTLSWVALEYAGWYVVEIQTAKDKPLVQVKTTEAFYTFYAYPGQYKLKISVYNKLGTVEAVSDWKSFTVALPPREVEEVEEEEKIAPRHYLILTHLEGIGSLGDLGLDYNYSWGFSTMGGIAFTAFTDYLPKGWTFGNHIYFFGKKGTEDSFIDFIGSIALTGFTGYRLEADKHFSCLPFIEIGLSTPFLFENKDQGLTENHMSIAFLGGFGSTFMLFFDKFFLSTTIAFSLNLIVAESAPEGESPAGSVQFNPVTPSTETGFSFTLGCGFLF